MGLFKVFDWISQYFKAYWEKIAWLFNNEWYKRAIISSFFLSYGLVFLRYFLSNLDLESVFNDVSNLFHLLFSWLFVSGAVWFVLIIIITSLYRPKGDVESNIYELPRDYKWNKIIVEYDPPKWLGPSEVWIIYSLWYDWTNLRCLILKWIKEWLITKKVVSENWMCRLERCGQLKYNVPAYERFFWNKIFSNNNREYVYEEEVYKMKDEILDAQQSLVDYCVEKWYLVQKTKLRKVIIPSYFLLFLVFIFMPLIAIIIYLLYLIQSYWSPSFKVNLWKLERTKKWDELYAKILWYKYFLEHCDEEKIKILLKEDSSYVDKTLPYVIALRLNWRFLNDEYLE